MNIPVSVFPDDLVFNILVFLPVKSLLRFKSVSKKWRCMISDPSFVEAHQSHRSATTALLVSTFDIPSHDWKHTIYTINPSVNEGEVRCLISGFSKWSISQSVNGFVCIYEEYPSQSHRVGLCNPSTREYLNLPLPIFSGPDFLKQVYSLGFDPSTKTYKILRSWVGKYTKPKYEIFTLGSDSSWRILKDNPNVALSKKGICLNGTIYWTKVRPIEIYNESLVIQNSIIAFNVGEEKFRYVPVPPAAPICDLEASSLFQIDGHIALVCYHRVVQKISNVLEMWKLEDSLNGIWSHKRIVLPEWFTQSNPKHSAFCVTSIDGGEIALIHSLLFRDRFVVYYNLEKERARREDLSWLFGNIEPISSIPYIPCDEVSVYVESLISLKEIACVCGDIFEGDNQAVGLNGSGKSTLLRSMCAATLLRICGFMVPAESALIPHFDSTMLHMKSYDRPADGKKESMGVLKKAESEYKGHRSLLMRTRNLLSTIQRQDVLDRIILIVGFVLFSCAVLYVASKRIGLLKLQRTVTAVIKAGMLRQANIGHHAAEDGINLGPVHDNTIPKVEVPLDEHMHDEL